MCPFEWFRKSYGSSTMSLIMLKSYVSITFGAHSVVLHVDSDHIVSNHVVYDHAIFWHYRLRYCRLRLYPLRSGILYTIAFRLTYTPHLFPDEERAIFFCFSATEATRPAKLGRLHSQGIVVTFNNWEATVNTIDPLKTNFNGWRSIRGLPFNRWNPHNFHSTGRICGGTIEIHPQTLNFSIIFAAKVKALRAADAPQAVYQLIDNQWVPIQLIPHFKIRSTSHKNGSSYVQPHQGLASSAAPSQNHIPRVKILQRSTNKPQAT